MAAISTYLANKLFDHVLRGVSYTPPTKVYLALYTTNPTASGTGTEVSADGTNYARQEIAFDEATAQATSNTAAIEFPKALTGWGNITHWGLKDASTTGNLLYFGVFTAPITIGPNNYFKIDIGDLNLSVT